MLWSVDTEAQRGVIPMDHLESCSSRTRTLTSWPLALTSHQTSILCPLCADKARLRLGCEGCVEQDPAQESSLLNPWVFQVPNAKNGWSPDTPPSVQAGPDTLQVRQKGWQRNEGSRTSPVGALPPPLSPSLICSRFCGQCGSIQHPRGTCQWVRGQGERDLDLSRLDWIVWPHFQQ